MANKYRNQRERAKAEIGVISPYANKRIITPISETIGHSPCFIGSLVSSFATIIADISNIIVHTCPNFLQLQIHFKFCLPNSFIIVSLLL